MPLIAGTGAPVVPPVVPPYVFPLDLEHLGATWTAPDGTVWPLTSKGEGWWTLRGADFNSAVPIEVTADPNPRYGTRHRHTQPQARIITWPLRIQGATHTEFQARWRALAAAFTQTRRLGPGLLSIGQPDGSVRQIAARYHSGFAGQVEAGWWYDHPVLSLYCDDPYWSAQDATVIRREYQATSADFLDPFPTISSSQTLGATVATNPGDTEAWPVWTITGPASSITATNDTTGDSFTLDPDWDGGGDLAGGDQVVITTDPPSVLGPDGSSWIGAVNWPSAVLWALQPGDNQVTFTVGGSGSGTAIELSFHPRYETA
jgi:hypothetical protein